MPLQKDSVSIRAFSDYILFADIFDICQRYLDSSPGIVNLKPSDAR